jgi:hypothetical protein
MKARSNRSEPTHKGKEVGKANKAVLYQQSSDVHKSNGCVSTVRALAEPKFRSEDLSQHTISVPVQGAFYVRILLVCPAR